MKVLNRMRSKSIDETGEFIDKLLDRFVHLLAFMVVICLISSIIWFSLSPQQTVDTLGGKILLVVYIITLIIYLILDVLLLMNAIIVTQKGLKEKRENKRK